MPEDFLSKIQAQVHARLRELQGVVAEYERLQAAAGALGAAASVAAPGRSASGGRAGSAAAGATRATRGSRRGRAPAGAAGRARNVGVGVQPAGVARRTHGASRRRKRAPRGANRDAILAALTGSTGGTGASELAKQAGVGRVSTYQVLSRLEAEQLVRREQPANGPALYWLR